MHRADGDAAGDGANGGGGGGGAAGGGGGGAGHGGGGGGAAVKEVTLRQLDVESAEKRQQQEELRRTMLSSVLTPEAKERLARVSMVRPENARAVEDHILGLARQRKLQAKVDEDVLVAMLEEVSRQAVAQSGAVRKVTIVRKKRAGADDDDDEDDSDL